MTFAAANGGTVWQDSDTIGLHLKNIFAEEELEEGATTEFFSVVQQEGKRDVKRNVKFYNLDAILSVGYRVNSKRGTQFRQWATQRLKDYLVQGYVMSCFMAPTWSGNTMIGTRKKAYKRKW